MKLVYGDTTPIVLAHRGAPQGTEENSLAAFTHAVNHDCIYLETDVRLGRDGVIYLRHGGSSLLPNRLLVVKDRRPTTLAQLLDKFPDRYIAIDPKHEKVVGPLTKLIADAGAGTRVCIGSSFDARAFTVARQVEKMTGVRPKVARVGALSILQLLCNAYLSGRFMLDGADYIHVPNRLTTKRVIRAAHARNLGIIAWVVNDPQRLMALIAWGIDGVMTDNLHLIKAASENDAVS